MLTKYMPFVLLPTALLFGCGSEGPETPTDSEMTLPPSMRETAESAVQQIHLTATQAENLKIKTITVTRNKAHYPIAVSAVVEPAPDHITIVSAPIQGVVVNIMAHEGETVRAGQPLLELESLEFSDLIAAYIQNHTEEKFRKTQLQRMQSLFERKIKSRKELEKAQTEYERARAALHGSTARLLAVGIEEPELEEWLNNTRKHPHLTVRATMDGVITEHLIDIGQAVNRYDRLGTIINPQRVMIRGYVSPEDADFIAPASKVTISLGNRAAGTVESRVHAIVPVLDAMNRSVTVTCFVENPADWLKPGRNVRMQIEGETPEAVHLIPFKAVVYDGTQPVVFVQKSAQVFEKRPITIGRITGETVIVTSGLNNDDRLAVTQVFSLKALSRLSEFAEE